MFSKFKNIFFNMMLVFVICTAVLAPITHPVFAESLTNTQQYKEINVPQIDFTIESTTTTNQLITNNGKPINSNIFKNNVDGGNKLFAVCNTMVDGVPCESYYFANVESIPDNELRQSVRDSEAKKLGTFKSMVTKIKSKASTAGVNAVSVAATPTSYIKSYSWSFYNYDVFGNSSLQSKLTTNLTLTRQSNNVDYNGKAASLWDVTSFSQLEEKNTMRLNDIYTRLDVSAYSAEKLIDYGPYGNSSGGTVSVGLDGLGVPSMEYSFSISGFSLTDYSSLSGNYGRWHFWDGAGHLSSIVTQPGIRATNTSGAFAVELSHTTESNDSPGGTTTHYTGVIQVLVSDR
jgi:hypothetical protein